MLLENADFDEPGARVEAFSLIVRVQRVQDYFVKRTGFRHPFEFEKQRSSDAPATMRAGDEAERSAMPSCARRCEKRLSAAHPTTWSDSVATRTA